MFRFRDLKIRNKLILTFLLVSLIFVGIFYFYVQKIYDNNVEEMVEMELNYTQATFNNLKERDINTLSSSLEVIKEDSTIKEIYLEQDRDKLYEYTLPLFKNLKEKYGITHWYFIKPDGRTFLRVHNKDIYDDEITRQTFTIAKQTQDIGADIELGKTAYALRVVMPYYNNGELIGYVELGEEIDDFLDILKEETRNEYSIIVHKEKLDSEKWKSVREVAGLRNNWDDIENYVIIETTAETQAASQCFTDENLGSSEDKRLFQKIQDDKMFYQCAGFKLQDATSVATGKESGELLSLINTTHHVKMAKSSINTFYAFIIILFISIIIMGYFLAGLIAKPIKDLHHGTEIIEKGDLNHKVGKNTKDEIGQLSRSFDIMTTSIKKAYNEVEKKVEERTKQLKAEKEKSDRFAKDLEKFKLAVDNTSEQIIITDPEGVILYANKASEIITGYSIKEMIGTKAGKLWGGYMDKEFYITMWRIKKEEKKPFIGEINNKRKNGEEYTVAISSNAILNKKGDIEFFIAVERDVTKEKEIDRAKSEFVSLASHQLRTPLSSINWYAEMLLAGDAGKMNTEQKDYVQEIYDGNQRMVDLVNALLNVSRIELGTLAVEPKPTNIKNMAEGVLKELRPQIKDKKQKVTKKYDKKLPKVNVDPKLMRIVFQNYLSNAVKYTPEKRKIDFEVSLKKKVLA